MLRLLPIVTAVMLTACSASNENYRVFTLPSGKQAKVVSVETGYSSHKTSGLQLIYETDLSLDDQAALEKEVDEIWQSFRIEVDKASLATAIISSQEKSQRALFYEKVRVYKFVFIKLPDGQWYRVPSKPRN
jgi:hypothetical protein